MIPSLLTSLALSFAPALDVDYAGLAQEFVQDLELTEEQAASFDAVIASPHFLKFDFGAFDIRIPAEDASDKTHAKVFVRCFEDLLELQRVWAEWTIHDAEKLEKVQDAVELLQKKFVKKLSASKFKKAAREEEAANVFEQLKVKEDVIEAEAVLREHMASRRKLADGKMTEPLPAQLVLIPTREQYVKLGSFLGKVQTNRRPQIWHASMPQGTAFWGNNSQVIALKWSPWPYSAEKALEQGVSMNMYEKTGQREHVVDRAAASMLWNYFYYVTVPEMETALSTALVVEVVGQNSLSSEVKSFEWSRAGASTEPYVRFIPGGNPTGGVLPPRQAQSGPINIIGLEEAIWEQTRAKDYFVKALHTSQEYGAKLGRDKDELEDARRKSKVAHFAVWGEKATDRHAVTAPFLGEEAEDAPVPPLEFLDDYESFFACYRTLFFHWLRTEAAGEESLQTFAKLLEQTSVDGAKKSFDELVKELYGVELADVDPTQDALEWRFLEWLEDQ